jgi:branched-chain amino acid transport system permease protein
VDLRSCRLAVLAIGAAIAGASGCLFAAGQGSVGPTDFDLSVIAVPFAIAVLGGSQGQFGIIAAAIVLAAVLRLFPELPEYRLLISGTALVCWAIWRATPQAHAPATEHKAKIATEAEIAAE